MAKFIIIQSIPLVDHVFEFMKCAISALGHACEIRPANAAVRSDEGIIIVSGPHRYDPSRLPPNSILFNLEQLAVSTLVGADFVSSLERRIVWDYSRKNIAFIRSRGIVPTDLRHIRLGVAPATEASCEDADQPWDVLIYGSLNSRRLAVLFNLIASGLKVRVVTGYVDGLDSEGYERLRNHPNVSLTPPASGAALDEAIARSKVVINPNYYESDCVDLCRVTYLLAKRKAIVSEFRDIDEIDDDLRDAVAWSRYESMADICRALVADPSARKALATRGAARIGARSPSELLRDPIQAALTILEPLLGSS